MNCKPCLNYVGTTIAEAESLAYHCVMNYYVVENPQYIKNKLLYKGVDCMHIKTQLFPIVLMRYLMFWFLSKERWTGQAIAEHYGLRDHTSVFHGKQEIKKTLSIKHDTDIKDAVQAFIGFVK